MDKTLQLRVIAALSDKLSAPLKNIKGQAGGSAAGVAALQAKLRELESVQRRVGQFREMAQGLPQLRGQMQAAQVRVSELAARMRAATSPTQAMAREFDRAKHAASQLKARHGEQTAKLAALRGQLASAGVATRSLNADNRTLKSGIAQTTEALRAQTAQLAKAAQQQRVLTAARDKMRQSMTTAGAMAATGIGARMTGLSLGRNMTRMLHVGYEFDAQMSALQGVTRIDDKNDPRMQALREQAKTLPLSSKFTDLEVAQGQFFLGRTGYSPQEIQAAMPHMLALAAGGEMDLATTADIASNIQTAMDIPRDQMQRVADVMAAMATRNNVNIQMMGQALKYSAVVGKELGQSFESVTAATAMLGNAGIQADMAGTTMRQIMLRMASSKKMQALGIQTKDENGNLRQLTDLLVDIGKVTGEMGNALRAEIFKDIADQRSVAAMSALMVKAQTGELQKMIAVAFNAQGEAGALAKNQTDNLKGDFSFLQAALQNISIALFEQNNEWLRGLAQRVTAVTHAVGEFLKQHPLLSKMIVMIGLGVSGLLTVFGSLTMALATLLGPLIIVRYASTVLGIKIPLLTAAVGGLGRVFAWFGKTLVAVGRLMLATPIGLAITVLAGLAYLLYEYWGPVSDFFAALWGDVTGFFAQAGQVITAIWSALAGALTGLWEGVKQAFAYGIAAMGALIRDWSPLALFHRAFAGVMQWFGQELPETFSGFGKMLMDGLIGGIQSMAGAVYDSIANVGSGVLGWFKEKLGIQSPSREMMALGGYVSDGAALGIARGAPDVARATGALAAAVTLGAAPMTALAAGDVTFTPPRVDTRPALAHAARPAPVTIAGDEITIHINVQGASQPQDIARAVEAALARHEAQRAARLRSLLRDTGLGALS